jgi:transcriptional regulator with XRE-family HTH domain
MSQEKLAETLGVSVGAVRDWEQGRRHPQPDTRPALAQALDVTLPDLALMLDGQAPTSRNDGHQQVVPGWLNIFVGLEQTATTFRGYEPTVLPGLLQTPAYAEAILRSDIAERSDADIARLVGLRLERQAVLTRTPYPLHLQVVVDEVALHRVAGSPTVMLDQLDHLTRTAELPNVEMQVLPFARGAHPIGFGAFVILGFPWGTEAVYLENRATATYLEAPNEVEAHAAVFTELSRLALSPGESVEFIRATRGTYR